MPKASRSLWMVLVALALGTTLVTFVRSFSLLQQLKEYAPSKIAAHDQVLAVKTTPKAASTVITSNAEDKGESTVTTAPPTLRLAPAVVIPPASRFAHGDAPIHNAAFIIRGVNFDDSVSRERGIVISIHKGVFALGLSLIRELRCLGNDELIQVYHCLPRDLPGNLQQVLLKQDSHLEIVDVCSDLVQARVITETKAHHFRNWWLKPLVLHHTDVQEVILLDADDILMKDPALTRQSKGCQDTGTLFFYDRVMDGKAYFNNHASKTSNVSLLNHIIATFNYTEFGFDGPKHSDHLLTSFAHKQESCHEQDSSMVAVDKSRSGLALEVLWYLIYHMRFTVEYSFGDKESFWIAYELAQQPYAFSPWGVSVVSSSTSHDIQRHPETLCGSIAQYIPGDETTEPELLYVNGKALLDPIPFNVHDKHIRPNIMYNAQPTHLVPRMKRQPSRPQKEKDPAKRLPSECLIGLGSTPLPKHFASALLRRRVHYLAASSEAYELLSQCDFYEKKLENQSPGD
ncbi:hypothetical protein Poli38472_008817 [Pythium oligandrum]|uniref:Uncharacterized protein n=1 Tax=Pythium oligandrum TaxID=41045 RepID=A0A8K1C453_PYTOL|nr:hypothetical protein Poli38472_008817 [Pythium oligandrum]|eukprot:TMW56169.1 hypothetical protein Poli38472_008817 [Pythium oligandrum]